MIKTAALILIHGRKKHMKRKKAFVIIAILIATTMLSGCIQMVAKVTIHEDMSADIDFKIGIAVEYYGLMEDADMEDMGEPGFTSQPYEEDGFKGIEMKGSIDDITKKNDALEVISDEPFITVKEENGRRVIRLDIPADNISESFAEETGSSIEALAELAEPDMRIVVTFPYDVVEHNATDISGRTLTWNLLEITDENLYAVSEEKAAGAGNALIRGLILALVALAIIAVTILILSKRKSAPK